MKQKEMIEKIGKSCNKIFRDFELDKNLTWIIHKLCQQRHKEPRETMTYARIAFETEFKNR
jgi:hypothetical protein